MSNRSRPVLQYDAAGHFVKQHGSVHEAARTTGVSTPQIIGVCQGTYRAAQGNVFRYYNGGSVPSTIPVPTARPLAPVNSRAVYQFTGTGDFVQEFPSIAEAARAAKVSTQSIWKVCQGLSALAGSSIWRYATDFVRCPERVDGVVKMVQRRAVVQKDTHGTKLAMFTSIKEAAEASGVAAPTISNCLAGRRKMGKGFLWEYAEEDAPRPPRSYRRSVVKCARDGTVLETFISMKQAEKATGIVAIRIAACVDGRARHAGGYVWKEEGAGLK